RAGDRSPPRSGVIPIVGEDFSLQSRRTRPLSRATAHGAFRDSERMPLICPTCQIALSNAGDRLLLCLGLFSILGARARSFSCVTCGYASATAQRDAHGSGCSSCTADLHCPM